MKDSTNISDLPDSTKSNNDIGNTYLPMNIHSNPFGTMQELQPFPRQGKVENQRLPSRDIAMNQDGFTHDEEVVANYIPKPTKNIKDYIKEYHEEEAEKISNHKENKKRKNIMEEVIYHIQEIVLVGMLFFISQMSIVNILMRKFLINLGIYDIDGHLNVKGMVLKSAIFTSIYSTVFYAGDRIFPFI